MEIKFQSLPYVPFRLTSPFISRDSTTKRTNIPVGATRYHDGIDCGRNAGKYPDAYSNKPAGDVLAVMPGAITESKFKPGRGHTVIIDHGLLAGKKITSVYQHLQAPGLPAGKRVIAGQSIGKMGRTGMGADMAIHLHFELQINGKAVDPLPYIKALQSSQSVAKTNSADQKLVNQVKVLYKFSDATMHYLAGYKYADEMLSKMLNKQALSKSTVDYIKAYKHGQATLDRIYSISV